MYNMNTAHRFKLGQKVALAQNDFRLNFKWWSIIGILIEKDTEGCKVTYRLGNGYCYTKEKLLTVLDLKALYRKTYSFYDSGALYWHPNFKAKIANFMRAAKDLLTIYEKDNQKEQQENV